MNERTAGMLAREIKDRFPHVGTRVAPYENGFIVGVFAPGNMSCFTLSDEDTWRRIEKAMSILVPVIAPGQGECKGQCFGICHLDCR
jgi:hypothetical protein